MKSILSSDITRTNLVDKARKTWMNRLVDVSRHNNLLYFRELKTGMLDLDNADPAAMEAFLAGEKVTLNILLPRVATSDLRERASAIFKRAQLNQEEKSLQTLYVAYGMASWKEQDGGRPPQAAIALLPVLLDVKGATQTLQRQGEPQINLALLHVLESTFGITVMPDELLAGLLDDRPETDAEHSYKADVDQVIVRITNATGAVEGWHVTPAAVLCNFSFQKMAMLRDIRDYPEQIAKHPVLTAMAGDVNARTALQQGRRDVQLNELDRMPANNDYYVLEADSSQQRVIASVARLQDGVIQGPPGTGKSQTIVNLIATLIAQGRRVLFVAEKRAALDVVCERLRQLGLDHMVLNLHGADVSSKLFYERLAAALAATREASMVDGQQVNDTYEDRRDKLNRHAAMLHVKHKPLDKSVYELQGLILRLPAPAQTTVRWRGANLDQFTPEAVLQVNDLLREGADYASLLLNTDPSPWTHATINNAADVQKALDLIFNLQREWLPQLRDALNHACEQLALIKPATVKDAVAFSALLDDVASIQQRYRLDIFDQPLEDWANVLRSVHGASGRFFARLFKPAYRNAINQLKTYRIQPADASRLCDEAVEMQAVLSRWRAIATGSSKPQHHEVHTKLHACIQGLSGAAELQHFLPKQLFMSLPLGEAEAVVHGLAADAWKARQLPRVREVQRRLNELKLVPLLSAFDQQHIPVNLWGQAFEYALYNSCLDRACEGWHELSAFSGNAHQQLVQSFRELDEERIGLSAGRIKRAHVEKALSVRNAYPDENGLIKSQSQKKRGRLQLRELLSRTPHVSTALFPCWMTSPLSISQLLKADQRYFDIVIFDEASQILPEDAVPAIMRADHIVVAGDRHQLPPTTFFAAGTDDDADEENPTQGYESILDLMTGISETWSLDWHYRSKDESLIAFSNKHIYQGRMTTFPNAVVNSAIRHVLVQQEAPRDSDIDSVTAEVNQVVELAMQHAQAHPNETLGVITMGIKHAERIERAIEDRLEFYPELEPFFDRTRRERFFVKNLERVQGDERDAVIFSIGYGKDASGRLLYRFGPLLAEGGERRLNVAVTRARSQLTLVSSFSANDMDPDRTKARGVELLRLYLQYAASEGRVLGQSQSSSEYPLNPFEADVYDALSAKGVKLMPQWGVSSYRIDFAVQHSQQPGRFVLAIECDGASYHSAPTARDRDRLRQKVLESLGWRFHRIWSTDWFNHREREIQRAMDAIQAACEAHDTATSNNGKTSVTVVQAKQAVTNRATITVQPRTKMPYMPDGRAIDAYPMEYLVSMVRWVQSDGKLRDDDELFEEVFAALGYRRRGDKITAYIRLAIARSKK